MRDALTRSAAPSSGWPFFSGLLVGVLLAPLLVWIIARGAPRGVNCGQSEAEWDRWVQAQAGRLVRASEAAYAKGQDRARREVLAELRATLLRCNRAQGAFRDRHVNFVDYVMEASLETLPGHVMGLNVPDRQYFAETSHYTTIPQDLRTQEFLRLVQRPDTLDQAKAYLARLNARRSPDAQLVYFSYDSRHLGTPDSPQTFGRLLIKVPPAPSEPEKWVQFGIADPGKPPVKNVSVVAVVPRAQPVGKPINEIYLQDIYRLPNADGTIRLVNRLEAGGGTDNCVKCHASGMLPIAPRAGSVSEEELPALAAVNRRFRAYGRPSFGPYIDIDKFGPGLGALKAEARASRIRARFTSESVVRAMNCASCHQAAATGAIHAPMDRVLVRAYILAGEMPPKTTLNDPELNQLHDLLIDEYFDDSAATPGIFKSWLTGNCDQLLLGAR